MKGKLFVLPRRGEERRGEEKEEAAEASKLYWVKNGGN
jgi:hypothetical protein